MKMGDFAVISGDYSEFALFDDYEEADTYFRRNIQVYPVMLSLDQNLVRSQFREGNFVYARFEPPTDELPPED